MDQETLSPPEKTLRPLSSKESSVWNALDKLYFEDQIPFSAITFRAIIEARKHIEGAGGDNSGLGPMRERWRLKHKIDPQNDKNMARHAVKGMTVDPLLRITSEIRNEIRASLEAEMEAEREEYISRIQAINAELSTVKTDHDALKHKHIALENEHQLLKEKNECVKAELIAAQTEKNVLERSFTEYKLTTAETFQKTMAEQGVMHTHSQQLFETANAQILKALQEQAETHKTLVSDIITKNENLRHRMMETMDAERTRADKTEAELQLLRAEKDEQYLNSQALIKNQAFEHQHREEKMRLEIQVLAEQFDFLRARVAQEASLIGEQLQAQMKEVLAKVSKLSLGKKRQLIAIQK